MNVAFVTNYVKANVPTSFFSTQKGPERLTAGHDPFFRIFKLLLLASYYSRLSACESYIAGLL